MKNKVIVLLGMGAVFGTCATQAQVTIDSFTPLSGFGTTGSGWLAPNGVDGSTYTYLSSTASTERGLAYDPVDNDLFLVTRNNNTIRILNSSTGADLGSLNMTGISGGTYAENMIAVGGDGAIYVGNLTTSATSPFKVYEYATPTSAPSLVYSGNPIGGATRLGDSLAAIGSGNSTVLAAGFGNTGTGNSGYEIISPSAGTASQIAFTGTPPNGGDFRLGITFVDSAHVIGTQGSTLYRYSSFSGTTGTLLASPALSGSADRPLGYITIGGMNIMASVSTGDNHVTLYDMTDPTSPVIVGTANATTGTLPANGNATGDIAWGTPVANSDGTYTEDLYAMSTNDGIQAFQVVIAPEPSTLALGAIGIVSGLLWRRRR